MNKDAIGEKSGLCGDHSNTCTSLSRNPPRFMTGDVALLKETISASSSHNFKLGAKIYSDINENYREFLNFGEKKGISKLNKNSLENAIIKNKVEVLGQIFKEKVDEIKAKHKKLDLIFLIDASSSIGEVNFQNELKFVKKLLSDVVVDYNHSRVAVITFSSSDKIIKTIDEISHPREENNKCLLLKTLIQKTKFSGGGTYTLGAFKIAQAVFERSRKDSKKVLFLVTDGFSNGGDPTGIANKLKEDKVTIFTIGIRNGNYKELYELSTSPGEYYSYLLDSFNEFESLARRALHVDLQTGEYVPLGTTTPCDFLCKEGNCCDKKAHCSCGTSTGHYSCICQPGYYGSGLVNDCLPCPAGSFGNGPNLCLPCPDVNHIAEVGSESCKCKLGYQSTKTNRCEVIKCSQLSPPDHGYFVKSSACAYVFNSACGVRCEVGYTLEGSSIRLCQSNGIWSGQTPICQIKTCEALSTPAHGTMICQHSDLDKTYTTEPEFPVDTVCSFACERGRTLVGSRQRTCLPLAHWDGLKTSCKQVKCNKLAKLQFGHIEPKSCMYGKQAFGKTCSFSCDEGFEIVGPREKHCTGLYGTWSGKRETKCKDVTKPKLTCPEDIRNSTLQGKNYGQATWMIPNVTDNSGLNVTLWTKPAIKDVANFKFKIGTTNVTYFAQDMFKNTAKCNFIVEIYDNEKPTIEDCENPPPFLSSEKSGTDVIWDEPNIFDNSQNVNVTKSHEFGYFRIGTTQVTYIATDLSGNINSCTLNITIEENVCKPLPDPIYGKSECIDSEEGVKCVITCLEGYAVPIVEQTETIDTENGSTQFICDNENPIWYNYENQIFPECTVTELPVEVSENVAIDLESEDILEICKNETRLMQLNDNATKDIATTLYEVCNDIECRVDAQAVCDDYRSVLEELSNLVKRQAIQNTTKRPRKGRKYRRKKNKKVKVNVQVDAETNQKDKRSKLLGIKNKIAHMQTLAGKDVVRINFKETKIRCSPGSVRKKLRCVQCPIGMFHNATRNSCQSCKIGFYNDQQGQTVCTSCPLNYSTRKLQAKSINDCIEQCSPGSFARKKKIKILRKHPNAVIERITLKPYCRSCPIGTYQPLYGRLGCFKCPNGYTTSGVGSTTIQDCVPTLQQTCTNSSNICNKGQCIIVNDVYYSCECSKYYIGSHCETKLDSCIYSPCKNGGTCTSGADLNEFSCKCRKGFSGETCETVEDQCNLNCLNNGKCMQDDNEEFCLCPKGFHGENCQHKTKYCISDICENGGQCIEDVDTFKCICFHGYLGRRCTHLPCDYRPCSKNAICENVNTAIPTRHNYRCSCEDGYTGPNCTEKVNPCSKNKCMNNATCNVSENSYVCECEPNFYGEFCENEAGTKFVLVFTRAGVTDSVRLEGFKSNLSMISICLWIQTMDTHNYGTILSYATFKYDNTFTITDYGGLVFYINNKKIYSDIQLNDGFWHYFCFTWNSEDGNYRIYVNGKVIQQGENFSKGELLEGNGKLVIGQEQDIMGGKFSQSEAFLGKITHFDVWNKVLSAKDVVDQMNNCNKERFGNVYAWPEMKKHVFGKVEIENSTFCLECRKSLGGRIHNGYIEILNNRAYYRCDKGYILSESRYQNGRHCNKAGEWEGQQEPYCKVLYCLYPGHIRHGRIHGRRYSYLSQIHYTCNTGYKMKGNDTRICGDKSFWEPEPPVCLGLRCKAFEPPENGKIMIFSDYSDEYQEDLESYDVGTSIEITCNKDAKLVGEPIITCEVTGEWDNEIPDCIKKKPKFPCSLDHIPLPPSDGYITEESQAAVKNFSSNVIEYKCKDGYRLMGDSITTCILDGYWTQPNITCELVPVTAKCPTPPKVKNAQLVEGSKLDYFAGDKTNYECAEGYRLLGNAFVKCSTSGKWSRFGGKCIRKTCGKPNVAESTIVQGKSYLFGEKVKITCGNGNEYTLTCESSGKWSSITDSSC
ncbi:hypothetical protein Trydic_g7621 [Trypoxylus dichotomus]